MRLDSVSQRVSQRAGAGVQSRRSSFTPGLAEARQFRAAGCKILGDFQLLVPGIGSDKISDLAINVIRGELAAYTNEQCYLYGIPTEHVPAGVFWNPEQRRWEAHFANFPRL